MSGLQVLTKADFESDQEIRWCPGCGDYSILSAVQKFLPTLGIPKEKFVFVSGIGCSSRFPYYMDCYGFHTIHGRAPAVATGVKLANPELHVWVVTGDGDALSIGGNHLLHLLRRNVDLKLLLFNNQIYGLTKGQYSPTSEVGKVTKSTPSGSVDYPVNPLSLALGAEATFIARTVDNDHKHMAEVLREASQHQGTAFVEIYQNCVIFNDDAFAYMSERSVREEQQLQLKHGEPLQFGKGKIKGITFKNLVAEIIPVPSGSADEAKALGVTIYDRNNESLAWAISRLDPKQFPTPVGVLYQKQRSTFDKLVVSQVRDAQSKRPPKSADEELTSLFSSGNTWQVS